MFLELSTSPKGVQTPPITNTSLVIPSEFHYPKIRNQKVCDIVMLADQNKATQKSLKVMKFRMTTKMLTFGRKKKLEEEKSFCVTC